MKNTSRSLILIGFTLFCANFGPNNRTLAGGKIDLFIPDSGKIQIVTCADGSNFFGRVTEIGVDTILFQTSFGPLQIPLKNIVELQLIRREAMKQGKYWFPNPNDTRLFFAPTGRMLPKGKGYFADYYLFFTSFAYGLSDRFTMGGGMSVFPAVDILDQVFYFTPKFGIISKENYFLSVGTLLIKVPDWGEEEDPINTLGILFGVGTYGSSDKSITFGCGYGYVDYKLADNPMFVLGCESRMSQRTAFVSENWIIPGSESPLISYGVRFFGEKLSVDLAFITSLEDGFFPGIPYIDFVVNW